MNTQSTDPRSNLPTSSRVFRLAVVLALVVLAGVLLLLPMTALGSAPSEPEHPPSPDPSDAGLFPSYKMASQQIVAPGERLTYTIHLINAGNAQALAQVTDRLPTEANCIPDSANRDGVYDPVARTLTWSGITVPVRSNVSLSFVVTMSAVTAPKYVTNTAVISDGNMTFERRAWVMLVPAYPAPSSNLYLSQKMVSRHTAIPGEPLTYTIALVNVGTAEAHADVSDPLPAPLSYVSESATGGGDYDPASRTLSWHNVTVPVRSYPVMLTYQVTASAVSAPALVTNTAVISADGASLKREAWVLLMPERPAPRSNLSPSYKAASRYVLASGELLTYTIRLRNVGTADAVADVTDAVPTLMNYVAGSASLGGVYDPIAGALSWQGVTVPIRSDVSLSFVVTGSAVAAPTVITNTAVISEGNKSLARKARVLLVPTPPTSDPIPPVVHSLTIDEQDVLTSPAVTLHISATDNVGVQWMYLREWQWSRSPAPRWEIVRSSGWITYQTDYAWTLGSEGGTHFVGVWVADAAYNTSRLDRRSVDFASLLAPGASVPPSGATPYLVYYDAGVEVNAALTPLTGDSDLYVWYTGHLNAPVASASQVVTFTTPVAGVYVFMVRGQPGSTYDLLITPGGGPRPPVWNDPHALAAWNEIAASAQAASGEADDLIALLTESGLNPPDLAEAPSMSNYTIYLPVVMR
jgi:uncharacterized repeat protein (TIGR01451 family)